MKPRRSVLITGAAGLLGSHLTDALLAKGCSVTGIDNLSIGTVDNLREALKSSDFQFVHADVRNPDLSTRMKPHDMIVHMAAYKIEVPGLHGTDILEVNSMGTLAMLKLAVEWSSDFVFASTSDVYGKNPHAPFSETHDLVMGPSDISRWGYAASKIFDEHLCFAYQRRYNLPVVVIRYFNTYGPRHELSPKSGGPQALFLDALLSKRKMIVHGDGLQTRCFAYIDDSIQMTVRAIDHPEARGQILNIGNPRTEITILDLARLAFQICGGRGDPPIEFIPHVQAYKTSRFEEVPRRIPDISKTAAMLDYQPGIDNREGMKRTYEWQKNLPVYKTGR